jgi:protein-tyrosine-phosphatase
LPNAQHPEMLFVCVHNAGRSQMVAALTRLLSGGRVRVRSAGSEPAERINAAVAQALAGLYEARFTLASSRSSGCGPTRTAPCAGKGVDCSS